MGTTKRALKAKRPKRVDRRKTTSTRITPETRAQLDAATAQSGRSLAQEIEARLERSFTVDEGFGDADTYQFCRMMAQMADMMTLAHGKRWKDDSGWFLYVAGAWTEMVKLRAGEGLGPDAPPHLHHLANLIRPNFDKDSSEELRNLGAQAFKIAMMQNKENEEK